MTSGSEMDPTSIPVTSQERPGTTQRRHKIDLEIGSKKTFENYAKIEETGCHKCSQMGDKSDLKLVPEIDRKTSKKLAPASEVKW